MIAFLIFILVVYTISTISIACHITFKKKGIIGLSDNQQFIIDLSSLLLNSFIIIWALTLLVKIW